MSKLPYNTSFVEYLIEETGEILVEVAKDEVISSRAINFFNSQIESGNYTVIRYATGDITEQLLDRAEKDALCYVLDSYLALNEEDIDETEWIFLNQIYQKLQ